MNDQEEQLLMFWALPLPSGKWAVDELMVPFNEDYIKEHGILILSCRITNKPISTSALGPKVGDILMTMRTHRQIEVVTVE